MGWRASIVCGLAALLVSCASRPVVPAPVAVHAPSSHRGLRVTLPAPRLAGPDAGDAAGEGLGDALQVALGRALGDIGYEVSTEPALESDFTLRLVADVARAQDVRAELTLDVLAGGRVVDSVVFSNRDARGWYGTERPFADHAAVTMVNALVRSDRFIEAARLANARKRSARKLAVLELQGELGTQELGSLGLAVRTVAVNTAARQGLALMTREAMLTALEATGREVACTGGECAVALGRVLGAEMVVSGGVRRLGDLLLLGLELHDIRTGRLVRATSARARTVPQLLDALAPAVRDLMRE